MTARSRLLVGPLAGALLGVGAFALAGAFSARPGGAEEPARPYELRFLSLSGDGSNAKVWFEGAPASGMKVQEALDRFTKEGFRYVSLSPAWRQAQLTVNASVPTVTTPGDPVFVLLLERGR